MNFRLVSSLFLLLLAASSCGFRKEKTLAQALDSVYYKDVHEQVFKPYCISCHGSLSGISLETFQDVRRHLERVKVRALDEKTMPQNAPLPVSAAEILTKWIQAGAPEKPGAPGNPELPGGDNPPVDPNASHFSYAFIRATVFEKNNCIFCHKGATPSGGINLETYQKTKEYLPRIALAVLPEVPTPPTKKMPPGGSISAEEKKNLLAWIEAGAPETGNGDGPIPPPDDTNTPPPSGSPKSYAYVRAAVFVKNNCILCHSAAGGNQGRLNLETYKNTKDALAQISTRVLFDRVRPMPPSGPIPADQQKILADWIEAKAPEMGETPPPPSPSFKDVKSLVIDKNCIGCHTGATPFGKISFDTYEQVKGYKDRIEVVVFRPADPSKKMPPGRDLPADQADLLKRWLMAGAPESGTSTPPPPAKPPSFALIKANVMDKSCIGCHTGASPFGKISFDTYEQIKGYKDRIDTAVFHQPDPKKKMPPNRELPTDQAESLRLWLDAGAPEKVVE